MFVALQSLHGGCLITDDITFNQQEDVPPALVSRPRSTPPIGDIVTIDTDLLSEPGMANIAFKLQVRDENVQQTLVTQARLRTLASPTFSEVSVRLDDGEIPGTGSAVREFEFSLPATQLRDGHCHQLQLAISGAFVVPQPGEDPIFAVPVLTNDLALATWWLWETSADTTPPVNPDTCPVE